MVRINNTESKQAWHRLGQFTDKGMQEQLAILGCEIEVTKYIDEIMYNASCVREIERDRSRLTETDGEKERRDIVIPLFDRVYV